MYFNNRERDEIMKGKEGEDTGRGGSGERTVLLFGDASIHSSSSTPEDGQNTTGIYMLSSHCSPSPVDFLILSFSLSFFT